MFDIGWSEMLVIAIVVIVVVGPKELPGMLRTFGKTTAKLRVMANDFRRQFDDAMKEAELDDVRKIADDVRRLNPANELKKALSPMEKAAQDVRAGLDAAMKPNAAPAAKPDAPATPAPAVAASPAVTNGAAAISTAAAKPAAPVKPAPSVAAAAPAAPVKTKVNGAGPAAKPAAATAKPAAKDAPKAKAAAKPKAASRPKSGGAVS